MHISVANTSPVTNNNPLSISLAERLAEKYSWMDDIKLRLASLPVIKRGLNKGHLPESTPHENAMEYAKNNGLLLFVGYLIQPDRSQGGLSLTTHSFCVDEKRMEVIEPTLGINWTGNVRYIGRHVLPADYVNLKYLNDFNRLFV